MTINKDHASESCFSLWLRLKDDIYSVLPALYYIEILFNGPITEALRRSFLLEGGVVGLSEERTTPCRIEWLLHKKDGGLGLKD